MVTDTTARPWLGLLAAAAAVLIWAGWISATRLAMTERVEPLVLAVFRNGVPALVLAPLWIRRGIIPRGASVVAVVLMTLGWGAPFAFLTGEGLKTVPASLFGPLVPGLSPLLVAGLSWLVMGERPSKAVWLGLGFISLALCLILGDWARTGDVAALGGAPFLVAASCGFSLYAVMFRKSGLSPVEATAYIGLYSMPGLAILSALNAEAFAVLTPGDLAMHLVVQGLLTGLGAVLAYGMAIRHLGPVRASAANAMVPVCAAIAGMLLLGEALGALGWLAVIAASAGVAVVNGLFSRSR